MVPVHQRIKFSLSNSIHGVQNYSKSSAGHPACCQPVPIGSPRKQFGADRSVRSLHCSKIRCSRWYLLWQAASWLASGTPLKALGCCGASAARRGPEPCCRARGGLSWLLRPGDQTHSEQGGHAEHAVCAVGHQLCKDSLIQVAEARQPKAPHCLGRPCCLRLPSILSRRFLEFELHHSACYSELCLASPSKQGSNCSLTTCQ